MDNVYRVLEKVKTINGVMEYLDMDLLYSFNIVHNIHSIARSWLDSHPAPSWRCLANALYLAKERRALDFLKSEYYKGEYTRCGVFYHAVAAPCRFCCITSEIQGGHETRAHSLTDQ